MPRLQPQGLNYSRLPSDDRDLIREALGPLGVEIQEQALCNLRFARPGGLANRFDPAALNVAIAQAGFIIINRKVLGDGSVTGALARTQQRTQQGSATIVGAQQGRGDGSFSQPFDVVR